MWHLSQHSSGLGYYILNYLTWEFSLADVSSLIWVLLICRRAVWEVTGGYAQILRAVCKEIWHLLLCGQGCHRCGCEGVCHILLIILSDSQIKAPEACRGGANSVGDFTLWNWTIDCHWEEFSDLRYCECWWGFSHSKKYGAGQELIMWELFVLWDWMIDIEKDLWLEGIMDFAGHLIILKIMELVRS